MQTSGEKKQTWRNVLTVEASAMRTATAVVGPLLVGQIVRQEAAGLVIGLGALYVCIADKFDVSLPLLLLTTLGAMSAVLAGSAVAANAPLDIALMACWAFGFGLLAAYGELAAHLGFVLTLIFAVAQGMAEVSPAAQWQRAMLFGGGGLIAVLATVVLRRVSPPLSPPPGPSPTFAPLGSLRPHFTPASQILWHAVRLTIAATVAVAIQKGLKLNHGHWIVITALVIVKPDYADTSKRALERVLGSVAGGIAAIPLAAFLKNTLSLDVVLVALCVLAYSHLRRSYGMYTAFLTPFIVLLLNASHPGDWHLALTRVGDSLIGGALAVTVAYLLRPRRKEGTPVEGFAGR